MHMHARTSVCIEVSRAAVCGAICRDMTVPLSFASKVTPGATSQCDFRSSQGVMKPISTTCSTIDTDEPIKRSI